MRLYSLLALATVAAAPAQTILPPFNTNYSWVDLGTIANLPTNFGGLCFAYNNPNVLLVCGTANSPAGVLFAVPVTRDPANHINGFGTAVQVATTPNNDGGLCFGPGNVLFFTQYSNNALGEIKVGSTSPDKTVDLNLYNINSSVGTCQFVPAGYPAAGRFKIASYSSGDWYDVTLVPDTQGTYDIGTVTAGINVSGGPEGILFPPAGSPGLTNYGQVIVNEYSTGEVAIWNINANAEPLTGTRQVFMTGLGGCEGAALDPVSHDFLFSTYGGGDRIIQVRGFGVCGSYSFYGTGGPGTNGRIPSIAGNGCPRVGGNIGVQVGNGLPGAFGALTFGFYQTNAPYLNFTIYDDLAATLPHFLSGTGTFSYTVQIPPTAIWGNLNIYWQAGYLDAGAPFGFSTTQGMQMFIR